MGENEKTRGTEMNELGSVMREQERWSVRGEEKVAENGVPV